MRVRGISLIAATLLAAAPGCAAPRQGGVRPAAGAQRPEPVVESALPPADRRALDRALRRYLAGRPGRAALAVHDRTTGARYSFAERSPFLLASVAKVDILLAFLLQRQQARQPLTARERLLAARMIRHSDNDSAHELYRRVGGPHGLRRALRALGVQHTEPGPGPYWGWTRSRPSDQVRVLEQLTDPEGPLTARHRRYALTLMSTVERSQAWGVGAAAPGGEAALKNGWLPVHDHGGLWTVNSVGRLAVHGHELLIAVLSERSPDLATGVATVERLAELAVRTLSRTGAGLSAA
ncbi:class A beta-lactamase-related serine hydrolase [Actinomadura sp. ATCC 31491]|uniref:Class A beta-lactamase-related serine hydrolase n=1 Tax=Actinomadura luzonensis TaxID=2805427 RepID=A0ABT0G032_9ACTN|nr:serine hydrolase [Actinomadura luzonensis]MCK2217956.1 class A beta-lactamase-related serine hydrolase [Actinomadura luzonensis]